MTNQQKAKGPDEAATSARASSKPSEIRNMNKQTNSTASTGNPAPRSDKDILDDMEDVDCLALDLRRAANVLEEYAQFEFRAGRYEGPNAMAPYLMTKQQVDGILYMTAHVYDISVKIQQALDNAYGREPRA